MAELLDTRLAALVSRVNEDRIASLEARVNHLQNMWLQQDQAIERLQYHFTDLTHQIDEVCV